MDFSQLSPEQRRACRELVGLLWGQILRQDLQDRSDFDGQNAIALHYAYKRSEAIINEALRKLDEL